MTVAELLALARKHGAIYAVTDRKDKPSLAVIAVYGEQTSRVLEYLRKLAQEQESAKEEG
ncbi:hypothetical protein [Calidithermus chliarophilus]|uniref:hypothetical protein n=1 Tax=Calidithermus chliarophilus TaxID=52023 RepID=UPI0003FA0448|nr:hypothetical protein [Calidithermus chliarophilus]